MNIFVSHWSEEAAIAFALKSGLDSAFGAELNHFISSDLTIVPPGAAWFSEMTIAMENSKALIAVLSPVSIERQWIAFETGAAWTRGIPIISVCHSGLKASDLPPPYCLFFRFEVTQLDFPEKLVRVLAATLGAPRAQRLDMATFSSRLREAELACASVSMRSPRDDA